MKIPSPSLRPTVQIFICHNERPAGAALPCCARAGADGVDRALQQELARRGRGRDVWLVRTRCLTFCSAAGATVVAWPGPHTFHEVLPRDVPALLDSVLGTPPPHP